MLRLEFQHFLALRFYFPVPPFPNLQNGDQNPSLECWIALSVLTVDKCHFYFTRNLLSSYNLGSGELVCCGIISKVMLKMRRHTGDNCFVLWCGQLHDAAQLSNPVLLTELDIMRFVFSTGLPEVSLELKYWGRNHKGGVSYDSWPAL